MAEFTPYEDSVACYTPAFDSSDTDAGNNAEPNRRSPTPCDSTNNSEYIRRSSTPYNSSATFSNYYGNGQATTPKPRTMNRPRRWKLPWNNASRASPGKEMSNASAKLTDTTPSTTLPTNQKYWVYMLAAVCVGVLGRICWLQLQPPDNVWEGAGNFPGLINLQSDFEGILENNLGGIVMAMDLKNSESAVRDLNTLVKYSKLPNRDDVSSSLDEFVQSAKSTSRQLSRFSSRVGGASDTLLAVDRSAIRALEAVAAARNEASSHTGIENLFPRYDVVAVAERSASLTYTQGTLSVESAISSLVREAMISLRMLDDLQNKLITIEDIAQREKAFVKDQQQAEKQGPLAEWYKSLTSNGVQAENFNNHLQLLTDVSKYRFQADGLVRTCLGQLELMQDSLENLRETAAMPGLLGEQIPLEEHIKSIRDSAKKLEESRNMARSRDDEYMRELKAAQDEAFKKFSG